jgi:hypothetical protein
LDFQEKQWNLTEHDLTMLGIEQLACIKPIVIKGDSLFAVHAADGTEIAVLADRDVAFAAVRQHSLEPVNVH